ncbi:MAG: hypothetical protein FWD13_09355 [Treponema sp.]|nr:hypothetical protein [Treponema sp.]
MSKAEYNTARPEEVESLRTFGQMIDGSIIYPKLHGYEASEKRVKETMLEYEKLYFKDMTFTEGSITGDMFSLYEDLGKERKNFFDVPFDLSISQIDVKFKNLGNHTRGKFIPKDMAIHFHYLYFDWRTVLHEMIHAYSYLLLKINKTYPLRDYLIIRLYDKLRDELKNIKALTTAWAHYEHMDTLVSNEWDGHGILFYLKSLDLEIELEQPWGMIRGYPFDKTPEKKDKKPLKTSLI